MKKKFLVLAYFYVVLDTRLQFLEPKEDSAERMLLVSSIEGEYNTHKEAEMAMGAMIIEESKNDDVMYFEIKEVYTKDKDLTEAKLWSRLQATELRNKQD